MLKKRNILPPLDYLVAFEAAAIRGSFAAAAREMHLSETAISRKVRLLELHYDTPLFLRGHRSISLTPQGHKLLNVVTGSLNDLRDISQDMFADHHNNAVTLAATNSVATLWLMPKLHRFNRSNARVKINLVGSDSDEECLAETMDLTILRGEGEWPGYSARLLFGETVFPVCSPKYLRSRKSINLADLPLADLIEVSNQHTEWMNWKTWLDHMGISSGPLDRAAVFNTYPLGIQAAVDGLGIALGWGHLVDHLLDSGALVRPLPDAAVRTQSGYYLLRPDDRKPFPEQEIIEKWLMETSAARRRYHTQGIRV